MRAVPCVSGKGPGRRGSHKDSAQHNSTNDGHSRRFPLMSVHLQIRSDTIVGFHDATFIFTPSDKIRCAASAWCTLCSLAHVAARVAPQLGLTSALRRRAA